MISQSVIEEVKIRNRLEDVISNYVRLEPSGRDLKGLCPFHSEKTPSFVVHPSDGYFHCFGCGAGGDVITFIMKAENLSYPEALEFLAQRAGITLPSERKNEQTGLSKSENASMNREAARYFHACLMDKNTPEGLNYLMKERGLSLPLIKHFGLGYAPDGFHGLVDHLRKKGYTYEQMVAGFLAKESKNKPGSYYDVFRARVMVPMLDTTGNVVAFSGRRIDGEKIMKYVNTSDTPAFRKGKYIFALNFAKDYCKERLILCEGQMDVIALHGAGFPQAIATMGTAITADQARIMKRYTDRVVICYDADEAGQTAADKAFALLSQVGIETRIIKVTGAKDPDEFIKKFGKDAFARLLDGSKTRFDHKFEQILAKYDLTHTDEKIRAANETVDLISGYPSGVERELYLGTASKGLGVTYDSIKADVERVMRRNARKNKNEQADQVLRLTQGFSDKVNVQIIGNVASARAEEAILGLMMLRSEIAQKVFAEKSVCEEDFVTDFNRRVFCAFRRQYEAGGEIDPLLLQDEFTPDETGRMIAIREERAQLGDNSYDILLSCVKRLRQRTGKENTTEEILSIINKKKKDNGQR